QKFTANVPSVLHPCFVKRAKDLGYPSLSAYLVSLAMYDLMIGKPHGLTGKLPELSYAEQDKVHDEVARAFESGETIGGCWLENRINEAMTSVTTGSEVPPNKVMDTLLTKIRKTKKG
ncbi:MAG: hypothetical protein ABI615_10735, partial [Chthoniobacterales bacterium]